ncbi:MAG: hypothetical protein EP299_06575 [Acidobacteria bacterium]|nr:MAG: hypothetical protein EP299_06575 [Acidobacteriota bacterium]
MLNYSHPTCPQSFYRLLAWTRRRAGRPFQLMMLASLMSFPVAAGTVDVNFSLPVKARLDMRDYDSVTVAPFIVVNEEGQETVERRGIDINKEFKRYLNRLLRRNTRLKIVDSGPLDYPTYDLGALERNEDFWRFVGERTQADLIVTGSLDFDIQDRSGYRTEEYVSPFDGRTYYRQVLVEQTGFEYDIVMQVYDGRTGKQLYTDNFKDFRQFDGERADPLAGMFENLYALEDRIGGIFAEKRVMTQRVLFTR